jgi:hypothetical protein
MTNVIGSLLFDYNRLICAAVPGLRRNWSKWRRRFVQSRLSAGRECSIPAAIPDGQREIWVIPHRKDSYISR